jgi:hypothetical protein
MLHKSLQFNTAIYALNIVSEKIWELKIQVHTLLNKGMWWLSWGCGGSGGCGDSVGDVVAQLGMWWISGGRGGSVWGYGGSVG